MKTSSFFITLILLACAISCPQEVCAQKATVKKEAVMLDEMIAGEQLWETTTEAFEAKFKSSGLQWLSATKEQARFFGNYGLWGGELKIAEAIAEFQGGKLVRVNLSLFNRGDSSDTLDTRKVFEKFIEDDKGIITAHLSVQPKERGRDAASAVKAYGWVWSKAPTAYLLEYSYQKENAALKQGFRAEFIRLRVAPIPKQQGMLASSTSATGSQPVLKASLAANVTREAEGDVVIKNVPMVDQGPKGYCAVATAERMFRYYGIPVDQHELAQVANTSEGGGTSPTEMFKSLTTLEARLHVKVRSITKWDFGEFNRMVDAYNREAKHQKKREVSLNKGGVIDIGEIYSSFDADALKETLTVKNKANYNKFQRTVAAMIDKGVPLMWGVELGIYKEDATPQARGGHMRLIIGYNTKTEELLYSDSWGAAHALKRMPMDNAFAMTTGLYYMEPLK